MTKTKTIEDIILELRKHDRVEVKGSLTRDALSISTLNWLRTALQDHEKKVRGEVIDQFNEPFDQFLKEHDPSIGLSMEQIRLVREFVQSLTNK